MHILTVHDAIIARVCRVCGQPISQPGPRQDEPLPVWAGVDARNGEEYAHLDCAGAGLTSEPEDAIVA